MTLFAIIISLCVCSNVFTCAKIAMWQRCNAGVFGQFMLMTCY